MSSAQELQESLFAEADAKLALDTGEKISIQAPVDVDRANGEVQRLRENLNMPESLELRAPDEGMPVHEIPTRTREEIEAARARLAVPPCPASFSKGHLWIRRSGPRCSARIQESTRPRGFATRGRSAR